MPQIYVISGPNGAGKTTAAFTLLPKFLGCNEYVNADAIAAGLSPFNREGVAIQAGRLMLARIRQLADEKKDFAFETTLASRSFVPFLKRAKCDGYAAHVIFLWLESDELAVKRVAFRVEQGGLGIPSPIIRRRFGKGLYNLVHHYMPIADSWQIYDNSSDMPQLIAAMQNNVITVTQEDTWNRIKE